MLQAMKSSLVWCPRDRTKQKPNSFTAFEALMCKVTVMGANLQLQRWTRVFQARAGMVEHVWTRKNLTDVTANLDSKDRIVR